MNDKQHGTQGIRPHLPNSGVCGHSAGDIFPYVIVLVGTPDAIKYHVIGRGLKLGASVWKYYVGAERYAIARD